MGKSSLKLLMYTGGLLRSIKIYLNVSMQKIMSFARFSQRPTPSAGGGKRRVGEPTTSRRITCSFNDRIEHQYLWNVLEVSGSPRNFIEMVKVLYDDIESVVKVSGGLSAPLKVRKGIRQGCSMSGMLYSIAMKPFLCKLRKNLECYCLENRSFIYLPVQMM